MTRRFDWGRLRVGWAWLLGTFLTMVTSMAQDAPPRKHAVQVSAQVQESPPRIGLTWPNEGDANQYWLSRRNLGSDWQFLATLSGGETSFGDANVAVGTKYEYQIVKVTSSGYTGYGYISAGIRIPVVDFRGKIILLVENSLAGALDGELNQLQSDLIGDGWAVIRRNASAYDSPQSVKDAIRNIYYSDPQNVRAVFLVGHVPVPYSGNFFPDGHENHFGAWPADSYYADVDGNWTDYAVNNTSAERQANWNVPGDGKFDQSNIPSPVELMVGRVDLNMTCYANKANSRSELDLMRAYFRKDHSFRFGEIVVDRRGLICDNFADKGADPISGSAWRNFSGFFGANNVTEVGWNGYIPAATQNSYLWSYGSGGGSYYYSSGVATSDDLALNDIHVIFTMWMGSYFGDWNNESNFLRASLGSGTVLTASYSGFPHTMYFPMALGEPIGYAIQITQNNSTNTLYPPWNTGSGQVHIGLLGDPTLRMHPFRPAANLNASSSGSGVQLSWSPSPDGALGYHIYRATSPDGPYTRITSNPVQGNSFTDAAPAGSYSYMVRAVRLEQTPSGTYFNLSQGAFAGASSAGGGPIGPPPQQPPGAPVLQATAAAFNKVSLQWNDPGNENGFNLERKTANSDWTEITTLPANTTSFNDSTVQASSDYTYRLRAFNNAGTSDYSPEIHVTTPAAPQPQATVSFVTLDTDTHGNWPDHFGSLGFAIATKANNLAGFTSPGGTWTWADNPTDTRAPLTAANGSTRVASAWFGDSITCNLSAAQPQRVALYFVDWDRAGRTETVTLSDAVTGTVLDSRDLSNFQDGVYAVYDIAGQVNITVTKKSGPNAVLSGVFSGTAQATPVTAQPLQLELRMSRTGPIMRLSGNSNQAFILYRSTNLINWTPFGTNALQNGSLELPIILDRTQPQSYYRTSSFSN